MAVEMLSSFSYHERPALVSHTSGTSTGKITTRCRSLAEVQAIWNVRSRSLPRDPLGLIPLTISVDGANHGQMIPVPSVEFGLKAVGFDHAVIDHVKQQIIRTYSFPGVTSRVKAIDAPLGFIKLLTCNLIASGIDPKEIGLELLSTYGEFVTSEWSHRLENLWGAMHSDGIVNLAMKVSESHHETYHIDSTNLYE